MRKILVFTSLLLFTNVAFAAPGDTTVIVITDSTLSSVHYHQVQYSKPTKLVFKNLTNVKGNIYFHQNTNLTEVDFPLLKRCDGYFYFHQNTTLQKIIAPDLNTVTDYLYVYGNTALTQLDVCNLTRILPAASNDDPFSIYYMVSNNSVLVDKTPLCFSSGAPAGLAISNDSINEYQAVNSFIGKLSAIANTNGRLDYYLPGFILDNEQFIIRNDSLLSARTFDYGLKNNYQIKINVVNQLGERTSKEFTIKITPLLTQPATTVIEIADTTLSSLYYHQTNYTTPTKLVFKNLTTVKGNIYFHQNTNLTEVDFPLLKRCDGYFYFHQNTSLQKIIAPDLNTVTDYLYVYGNTALTQLDVCNLTRIIPAASNDDPFSIYYMVSNNSVLVDKTPLCFSKGSPVSLTISNDTIRENQPMNGFVGKLSANANANDKLNYYLSGNMPDNGQFTIRNDSLLSATTFDYEERNNYRINITAVNQVGERTANDFSIKINDLIVEDTVVLIMNDTTMSSVYYHHYNFITPTKLVFKNLTRVTNFIYFHQNTNLTEVDFPLLDSAGGYFYFHENRSLHKVIVPVLNTVNDYLYIYGNASLARLDICSLTRILPGAYGDPYYFISNNAKLDYISTCLTKTTIIYVPVNNIMVQPAPNTCIGHFISDAAITDHVKYYFADSTGKETTNPDFVIRGDSLFLTRAFDLYANTNFSFDINAVRMDKALNRTTGQTKSLNEKIFLRVNMDIANNIRYVNKWIGLGTTPGNSAWENPGNWSSNILPDANTDVTISSGNVIVGTNVICRSLTVAPGATIVVKAAFTVTITH